MMAIKHQRYQIESQALSSKYFSLNTQVTPFLFLKMVSFSAASNNKLKRHLFAKLFIVENVMMRDGCRQHKLVQEG